LQVKRLESAIRKEEEEEENETSRDATNRAKKRSTESEETLEAEGTIITQLDLCPNRVKMQSCSPFFVFP